MLQFRYARAIVVFTLFAGMLAFSIHASFAQSGRKPVKSESRGRVVSEEDEKTKERDAPSKPLSVTTPVEIDDNGVIKLDTFLVTVPVSVIGRDGRYAPFLKKSDFRVFENGIEQDIESVESVSTPFHVALVLDTSNSTKFKLEDIQDAANKFVNQLREDDQIMVAAFDDKVRFLSEFSTDRGIARDAIYRTRTGGSTKLYEAMYRTLDEKMRPIEGRKAIVVFTDGVDTSSRRANARNTIELVDEMDTLIFPIAYDTMDDTRGGIYGPGQRQPPVYSPFPIPSPRGGRRWPFAPFVFQWTPQWPGGGQWPGGRGGQGGGMGSPEEYERGARYLQQLADHSGGRLYKADTLSNVASAFTRIAEELRYQYRISYYPKNSKKDGTFREVKVRVKDEGMVVRTRSGYKARTEGPAAATTEENERPQLKKKQLAEQ